MALAEQAQLEEPQLVPRSPARSLLVSAAARGSPQFGIVSVSGSSVVVVVVVVVVSQLGATLAEQVVVQIVPAPSRIVSAPGALRERKREGKRENQV